MEKTEQKTCGRQRNRGTLSSNAQSQRRGEATDDELREQTWEILNAQYRSKTDLAFREMKEKKVKRSKSADRMIEDLESR